VNQTFFRVGVRPFSLEPLQNVCPAELNQKIEAWREVEVQHQAEHARLIWNDLSSYLDVRTISESSIEDGRGGCRDG
jgi:hypothetical protein